MFWSLLPIFKHLTTTLVFILPFFSKCQFLPVRSEISVYVIVPSSTFHFSVTNLSSSFISLISYVEISSLTSTSRSAFLETAYYSSRTPFPPFLPCLLWGDLTSSYCRSSYYMDELSQCELKKGTSGFKNVWINNVNNRIYQENIKSLKISSH